MDDNTQGAANNDVDSATTVVIPKTPDLSYDNQGFEYAVYANPIRTPGGDYANFDSHIFKTAPFEYSGKTAVINIPDTNLIYGRKPSDPG